MFFFLPVGGDFAVPPCPVHGVDVGGEDDMVEVPDYYGEAGKDGFVVVDGDGDLDDPAGEPAGDVHLEPDHEAGDAHDDDAPCDGPVFEFLRVAEPGEPRAVGTAGGEVAEIIGDISQVLETGEEVAEEAAAIAGEQ